MADDSKCARRCESVGQKARATHGGQCQEAIKTLMEFVKRRERGKKGGDEAERVAWREGSICSERLWNAFGC